MPRRSILTASEKESLIAIPESEEELIRYYTLSETDFSIIRQHRGAANRLGFTVQLCCMRYPGIAISSEQQLPKIFLEYLADQLEVTTELWIEYGRRQETRREYLLELQSIFDFELFSMKRYDEMIDELHSVAEQTDKGIVIAPQHWLKIYAEKIYYCLPLMLLSVCVPKPLPVRIGMSITN